MGVDLNVFVKGPMFVHFKFAMKVCFNYFLYALLLCDELPRSLKVHDRSFRSFRLSVHRSFRLSVQFSSDIVYHASGVDLPRADTLIITRILHGSHFFEFRDHSRVRRKRAVLIIKREWSVDSRFTSDKPSLLTVVATSKPGSPSTNYQILEQQKTTSRKLKRDYPWGLRDQDKEE